jgi:hypothetical protein
MGPVVATGLLAGAEHPGSDDRNDARRQCGGVRGPTRQIDGGAKPVGREVRPTLRVHSTHADHDPAVEGLVDTHRALQLLDNELECSPTQIRHCEPPSAGLAADRRRA